MKSLSQKLSILLFILFDCMYLIVSYDSVQCDARFTRIFIILTAYLLRLHIQSYLTLIIFTLPSLLPFALVTYFRKGPQQLKCYYIKHKKERFIRYVNDWCLTDFQAAWISDKTVFQVFDIASNGMHCKFKRFDLAPNLEFLRISKKIKLMYLGMIWTQGLK